MEQASKTRTIFLLVGALALVGPLFAESEAESSFAAVVTNPLDFTAKVLNPFNYNAEVLDPEENCPPGHHVPWLGDWAFDIWKDDGTIGESCGVPVFLRAQPHQYPGGITPDSIMAKVVDSRLACGLDPIQWPNETNHHRYLRGGYQQEYELWATYGSSSWTYIGSVRLAHIDNRVYDVGDWIFASVNDSGVQIGTAFTHEDEIYNDCWGSCHIHMEFDNASDTACWNVCPPEEGIDASGLGSIVGLVGGAQTSLDSCMACTNTESLGCHTWDGDIDGCNAHGIYDPNPADDTQDCAYYTTTNKCRARGTSNCVAGCTWCSDCLPPDDESLPCHTWDGDIAGCNAHGMYDTNPYDDTQDCAYYTTTNKCRARGTSNCAAGCTWCSDCSTCSTSAVFENGSNVTDSK